MDSTMDVVPDGLEVAEAREFLSRFGYWMDEPRRVAVTSVYEFPWSVMIGRGASSMAVYRETLNEALEEAKGKLVRHFNSPTSLR
jgi:transcriptional regulator of nitric oxide reductase